MSLLNLNTNNKLVCNTDDSAFKGFIFDGSNNNPTMSIVQGALSLLDIPIKGIAIPLDEYIYQEFVLKASKSLILGAGNILSTGLGEVQFLAILVEYPVTDTGTAEILTQDKYIQYEYPTGGMKLNIGSIMILSGTTKPGFGIDLDASPGGLNLINPHSNFDVRIKVLAFN